MNTNHKPATALPWTTYCKTMLVGDKRWDHVALFRDADDAAYAAHTGIAYPELVEALKELVARCDGAEGVRADGSNIQTHNAHGILTKLGEA